MSFLSRFKHIYYSFDIAVGFLLCFLVGHFSSNLHISAKICKNPVDLHRFAKIENLGCASSFRKSTFLNAAEIKKFLTNRLMYQLYQEYIDQVWPSSANNCKETLNFRNSKLSKKSHNAEKLKGGTIWDFKHPICCKISKRLKVRPFGEKKVSEKNLTVPKKL